MIKQLPLLGLLLQLIAAGALFGQQLDALQLYRQGNFQEAIAATLKEIEANPNNMNSYSVLGWSLNNLKRYTEAIEYALKAIKISPNDHRIVGILAEANYSLGRDLAALTYYKRYVSLSLDLPGWDVRYLRDAYRDMGEIFLRLGELHHADMAFSTAIAYDKGKSAYDPPRASVLWTRLGVAREAIPDKAAAILAYQTAVGLNPQNTNAKAALERLQL